MGNFIINADRIFRKRGGLKRNETWTYGDKDIEVVNSFNYLGVNLNYTGNFNLNMQTLHGKGIKAMSVLVSKLKCYDTKPKLALQLFDSFVAPTIMYGGEIWGFCNTSKLENVHVKFCKTVLGIRQSSSNAATLVNWEDTQFI